MRISPHFTLAELTHSETATRHGIDIVVPEASPVMANLQRLCHSVLEPVREAFGPTVVLSGYRSPEVNTLVGGAAKSQHLEGLAADILCPGVAPLEVCRWIHRNLPAVADQIIHEFGRWTHVSIAVAGQQPRRSLLTAVKAPVGPGGAVRTVYVPGLHSIDQALTRVTGAKT